MSTARLIYAFDRVHTWLDVSDPHLPIDKLRELCGGVDARVATPKFHARWKYCVELFQPTVEALELFAESIPPTAAARIASVEIACDVPNIGWRASRLLRDAFLGAARMKSQQQAVRRYKTVWYFGRRQQPKQSANEPAKGGRHVMALYVDRPSKLLNVRPDAHTPKAFHVEWRARQSDVVAGLGIVTVRDLVNFDHEQFWDCHVRMLTIPSQTRLGHILHSAAGRTHKVSGSALRKRAKSWRDEARINGKFVMHNALRGSLKLVRKLDSVPWPEWWTLTLADIKSAPSDSVT